jgi:hypothetical protein
VSAYLQARQRRWLSGKFEERASMRDFERPSMRVGIAGKGRRNRYNLEFVYKSWQH